MKKLLFSLLIGLVAFTGTAQSQCQAYFSTNQDSMNLYMNDYSYNMDSTMINVISWDWTITGMGVTFTYTGQNPIASLNNLPDGTYLLCLNITTATSCTSSYCDSVIIGSQYVPCISWVDMNVYPVTVVGGNDGAIDITVYGGTAPYTYSWNTGATTEDLYGVPSGTYSCTIESSDLGCSPYSITATILEPYDSSNVYVDTLIVPVIDSCFTFVPDSFYISGITTNGNIVSVTWVFSGAGQTATLTIDYTYSNYGSQVVIISINCNVAKTMSTYMSYIYIYESVGIDETQNSLDIYPNPANDFINIPENTTNLRIISMEGATVKEISNPGHEVDVRELPEGVYIIMGESATGYMTNRLSIIR